MEEGETKGVGGYGGITIWGQGGPDWLGIKFKKSTKPVVAYRCVSCGYLESYAK